MISPTKLTLMLALGVAAVPYDGPSETIAAVDLLGRSPMPTGYLLSPLQIFRRQEEDDGICGYISGVRSNSVSCTVGDCKYNARISWFGCCTGTALTDCDIATSCVASASVSSCINNPSCAQNPYVTACTRSDRPACASISSVATDGTVTHLVCAPSVARVELLPLSATLTSRSSALNGTASTASGLGSSASSARSSASSSSSSAASASAASVSVSSSAALSSSRASASSAASSAASSVRSSASAAATTSASSAGSVKVAQAMLGAGGFVGFMALFL